MVFNPSNERSKKYIYIYMYTYTRVGKREKIYSKQSTEIFGGWRSGGLTRAKFIAGAVSDS